MDSLDGAAFRSAPNECSAAKTATAPKLDLRCELVDRREEAPIASGVLRYARRLRVASTIAALLAVLGVGWGAGLKTREFVSAAQMSTWFQETAGALVSNLDAQRKRMMAGIEDLANEYAPHETSNPSGVPDRLNTAAIIESLINGLSTKLDQLRASSEISIGELGREIERLNGSVERSQRELIAKIEQLQERLAVEHGSAVASGTIQPQPPQQPNGTPATRAAAPPLQPSAPSLAAKGTPKPTVAPLETKRIDDWAVTEIVNGTAILEGPGGIVGVSVGDVVPGVGRVQSIFRRGGRWVVATSKGVITGQ